MAAKVKIGICVTLIILTTLFIFSNSLRNTEESFKVSTTVTQLINPGEPVSDSETDFSGLVRKSAHLVEFALLGIFTAFLMINIKDSNKKTFIISELFYILLVAVTDEFIQSFTGRTSAVADVLLDFAGGIIGISFTTLLTYLFNMFKKSKIKAGDA